MPVFDGMCDGMCDDVCNDVCNGVCNGVCDSVCDGVKKYVENKTFSVKDIIKDARDADDKNVSLDQFWTSHIGKATSPCPEKQQCSVCYKYSNTVVFSQTWCIFTIFNLILTLFSLSLRKKSNL